MQDTLNLKFNLKINIRVTPIIQQKFKQNFIIHFSDYVLLLSSHLFYFMIFKVKVKITIIGLSRKMRCS